MGVSPDEGPELHDRDESTQIVNLSILIITVDHAREVEQLSTLRLNKNVIQVFSAKCKVLMMTKETSSEQIFPLCHNICCITFCLFVYCIVVFATSCGSVPASI